MNNNAAFSELLDYLKEEEGISNNAIYKQLNLTPAQGKARKDGKTPIETSLLREIGAKYPETIYILKKHKVDYGEDIDAAELKINTLKTIERMEAELLKLKDQVNRGF